jgi:DNA-binding transcriptional MerR regulator
MATYSIKDLERLSGIKAHTIRIWEKRYGLVEPDRSDTNIRSYSDEDLKKMLNISILNRNGIKISRIVEMDKDEIAEKILMMTRDSSDFDSLIENMLIAMVDMDTARFDSIITRAILQIGFEDTVLKIVYPFLDKIGILWLTGSINPAQEHFVAHYIRQKLVVAIDSVIPKQIDDPKNFLLFLPEGELHEIGLLFYSYLIQKRGHRVTYLGQWVPLKDMVNATRALDLDYLLTSIVAVHSGTELEKYISRISESYPGQTIFISGLQTLGLKDNLPSNIIRLKTVNDLLEIIS